MKGREVNGKRMVIEGTQRKKIKEGFNSIRIFRTKNQKVELLSWGKVRGARKGEVNIDKTSV